MALDEAVIDAGAGRIRPMPPTAAAVVGGRRDSLRPFDPIFQGREIALMAGDLRKVGLEGARKSG